MASASSRVLRLLKSFGRAHRRCAPVSRMSPRRAQPLVEVRLGSELRWLRVTTWCFRRPRFWARVTTACRRALTARER